MSAEHLDVPRGIAEQVLAHARDELPNEACGLLSGDRRAGRVLAFHAARNLEASPYRYEVHPEDLVRIVCGLETTGDELLAIFHSHTRTAAVPSAVDVRAEEYGVLHLLASLADAGTDPATALRAWRIEDGERREVALTISG